MYLFLGVSVPHLHRLVVRGGDDDAVGESQRTDPAAVHLRIKHSRNYYKTEKRTIRVLSAEKI